MMASCADLMLVPLKEFCADCFSVLVMSHCARHIPASASPSLPSSYPIVKHGQPPAIHQPMVKHGQPPAIDQLHRNSISLRASDRVLTGCEGGVCDIHGRWVKLHMIE